MKEDHHRLLRRQVRRHFPDGRLPESLAPFLQDVSDSYQQYDSDRALLERAMNLSSEELLEKNQDLKQKNQLLDTFIYRASHDLKAPTNNIIAMVDMLSKQMPEDASPMVSKIVGFIESASHRLLEQLQAMLELSRAQKNSEQSNERIDLEEMVNEVWSALKADVESKDAQIKLDFSDAPILHMEPENMRSVLQNLIGNAIKYSAPERRPLIEIVSRKEEHEVVLTIADNGLGMDMNKNGSELFGMFNRFHSHVEGTGVGLYIVKQIVDNHHGRIDVQSSLGVGTTFTLSFPDHVPKSSP